MELYIDLCTGAFLFKLHDHSIYLVCLNLQNISTLGLTFFFPDVSRKIMRGIGLALGGSADEMEGKIAGDPFWVLRTIGYPASSILDEHDKANDVVGW